ncbi:hypothetical protein LY39_03388 [Roseinatronobacter bogoriensis subsp. barguzinensis]|nr:hypothetical protein [Rhodobaca bogoriensis DSM 18756]TDW34333.1 hypothetical protein LY39_03388 [Rhodobaca barguzinensis]TDY67076.1 hypothetical protein EV660_10877 [Rhodobaca bogoriensis DSM 18756]
MLQKFSQIFVLDSFILPYDVERYIFKAACLSAKITPAKSINSLFLL